MGDRRSKQNWGAERGQGSYQQGGSDAGRVHMASLAAEGGATDIMEVGTRTDGRNAEPGKIAREAGSKKNGRPQRKVSPGNDGLTSTKDEDQMHTNKGRRPSALLVERALMAHYRSLHVSAWKLLLDLYGKIKWAAQLRVLEASGMICPRQRNR